jgi:hypothetical protein
MAYLITYLIMLVPCAAGEVCIKMWNVGEATWQLPFFGVTMYTFIAAAVLTGAAALFHER